MHTRLVIPCFNEAARWDDAFWTSLLSEEQLSLIFVDDGSDDGTAERLDGLRSHEHVTVIDMSSNRGKAEAVREGMRAAVTEDQPRADIVGYLDADAAFIAEEVVHVIRRRCAEVMSEGFDALWSARVALAGRDIRRSTWRHYVGRAVSTYLSRGVTELPYDTQCGFKLFANTPDLANCLSEPFSTRWFVDLEIYCRFHSHTGRPMRVWEEPLQTWHDVSGSKAVSFSLPTNIRITREVRLIRRELLRSRSTGAASTTRGGTPRGPSWT